MHRCSAVILCGGQSRRFGASDKTAAVVGGHPILDRTIMDLPPHWPVTCVGPARPVPRSVQWVREEPAGGGPVAGIAAALTTLATPYVVVLAGDLPFGGAVAAQLAAAVQDRRSLDGVQALDENGERQPLLAAYRTDALRRVIPEQARDLGVRRVLRPLTCGSMDIPAWVAWDVDTPEDLERARQHHAGADRRNSS
ncbi:molybdenum cofactor guanylyltransferase [Austwickia sp. TVS 96-490-7B]|uniref:molybdenum cofactor guanylyltransferase n=1 Tax=Austwickia sp. TVS 96-490-7B TaxID=2830843 RepID=UPI001C5716C5|nr:NTP transferase domain-containing protein [Austwickia sp. TVS 96-490-7B]